MIPLKLLRALCPTPLGCASSRCWRKTSCRCNELQEITRLGQSRISTHLGLLQDAGLVRITARGQAHALQAQPGRRRPWCGEFIQLAIRGAGELPEHAGDQINLKRILARRREQDAGLFQPGRRAALTASTARAGPGRRLANCCCGCCPRWWWRISGRARAC